jgi:FkbM family methyltransferase
MTEDTGIGLELKLMMAIGRCLPRWPHASAVVNRLLKPLYLRKRRKDVWSDVHGFPMRLDPHECIEGNLLFCPQLYEHKEIAFLRKHLQPGDVFVDVGANIGLFSLVGSRAVGERGRVVAIEPDPVNFSRLDEHIRRNDVGNIQTLCCGVSDREEILPLGINTSGNRGGSSFLSRGRETVPVRCHPLYELLLQNGIARIDAMKIDIEGMEYQELKQFFHRAPPEMIPRFVIAEQMPSPTKCGNSDIARLLREFDYRVEFRTVDNYVLLHEENPEKG